MKSGSLVPAILTIYETSPGQYVVRVGDLNHRPLVIEVAKLLHDATSLVVVTPADIKVLKAGPTLVASRTGDSPAATTAQAETAGEIPMDSLDQETQAAIREQEQHALPGTSDSGVSDSGVQAEPGMRVVRRKSNGQGAAGHPETCGRCRGEGKIRIIDETGGPGQAPCGVCQGTGVLQRYGSRRV